MCTADPVTLAIGALKIGTAVSGWQEQRQQASNQAYADYKTRRNADQAYLNDLSKIETERGNAAREKGVEEFRAKMEARKNLAKGQNLGFGNALRVAQDVGTTFDQDYNDIMFGFESDMYALNNQRTDAYANLQRIYNNIAPVYMSNSTDLALRIGNAAANTYTATS